MTRWGSTAFAPMSQWRSGAFGAQKEMEKLRKKGRVVSPVVIEGRKIARSFWGKAWCDNLERYSDFANRLPRGRTYVGNGSVVDLQIARGEVEAMVSGSEIYRVKVDIAVAAAARWKAICQDCAGSVGSLVELLQGKLSKNVMERVCREADGLFPTPAEIKMSCSCPDWADMCKHVAATLYGVGARLDSDPDLLFTLRGVDRAELISTVGADLPLTTTAAASERVLADDDVAALFGIDIAAPDAPPANRPKQSHEEKSRRAARAGRQRRFIRRSPGRRRPGRTRRLRVRSPRRRRRSLPLRRRRRSSKVDDRRQDEGSEGRREADARDETAGACSAPIGVARPLFCAWLAGPLRRLLSC